MKRFLLSATLMLAAVHPLALTGADAPGSLNRLSFGARFGINFKADFNSSAAFKTPGVNPGLAVGGVDHFYDDGYVRVDTSGNLGGLTTFWGFQNASQVVAGSMEYHAIHSGGSASVSDDPQFGGELIYQRIIGSLPASKTGHWGIESGFGYTQIDLRNRLSGTVPVTTDTFPLNGVLPPAAPYNGTFLGPGALLGDVPVRTTTQAAQSGQHKLSGDMFSIRLGPFAEWDLTDRLSLAASVGVTLAPTTIDYDFSETSTLASGASFGAAGHSSKSKLLWGPYVSAMLRYELGANWGIYIGGQFQNLTRLGQSIGSRTGRFDPGTTVFVTSGVTWRF